MMQEASKRRCNKIKFISLSFVSKLFSQKILITNEIELENTVARDVLGGKRILIMKINAQHYCFEQSHKNKI